MANTYTGIVQKGSRRAAALGFPTINIPLEASLDGVYIGRVRIGAIERPAAIFADPRRQLLEAHAIGFDQDVYGKEVEVEIISKLRDTEMFSDDAALTTAISRDIAEVRAFFKL